MTRVTLVVENTTRSAGLLAEHGLSLWIDTGRHRVLFDCGQGMAMPHNAERLGIDLGSADAIVLSHGHYDHVGGLEHALEAAPHAALWLHPDARQRKFRQLDDGGAKRLSTDFVEAGEFGEREVRYARDPAEVVAGVWLSGEIPRVHSDEDTGGPFFRDQALSQPDPLADDMALIIDCGEALGVVFGCAHAGAMNTLDHIRRQHRGRPVHTLLGGLHLANAGRRRLDATCAYLRELGPRCAGFCHCTGRAALCRLAAALPESFTETSCGTSMEIP